MSRVIMETNFGYFDMKLNLKCQTFCFRYSSSSLSQGALLRYKKLLARFTFILSRSFYPS